jgi:predicted SAM-dependent methyltransferase
VTARIKIDLEHLVRCGEPIVLDLGCGARKGGGRIGIDKLDLPSVDIVADVEEGLPFLADNSVDEIHAKSFLEHVRNFELLMTEIVRVLKPGGRAHVFVPHFSNPYYYSDYTHIRFFGLYTFQYFVNQEHQLRRGVPNFYTTVRIRVLSQELVFMSPFKRRHRVKKLLGFLVNLHRATQEFYEENLCYIFPCYGLKIIFTPDKVPA